MYRMLRSYENLQKKIYPGTGPFQIPQMDVVHLDVEPLWIGFNYARSCEEPEEHGVHFFVDDYQFNRCWTDPDRYTNMLSRFQAVCSPDFSLYTDFPVIAQIWNHYRKHWLARYWQDHGLTVIPTVCWSTPDSYSWCFDGDPIGGTVALTAIGTQADRESATLFRQGYDAMLERLQPDRIIFYGEVPEGCRGNITVIPAFLGRLRALDGRV